MRQKITDSVPRTKLLFSEFALQIASERGEGGIAQLVFCSSSDNKLGYTLTDPF